MNKAEIRKTATKRRAALTEAELQEKSEQLLSHFSKLDFSAIKVIHTFIPITKKKEPDTFLFIDWLQQHHPTIKIIVPRADFDTALMTHHEFTDREGLVKNVFDILEPQNINPYHDQIDLVLIPLLAFDVKGYRVGYGKGFYDRFLQNIQTKKVGLSLFPPVDRIDDTDEFDVKMDVCLSPAQVYVFNAELSL
jgi:5-formyltetrahydrofolate cyclo-ligase